MIVGIEIILSGLVPQNRRILQMYLVFVVYLR